MSQLLIASKDGPDFSVPRPSGVLVNHRQHPFDATRHEVVELPEGLTVLEYLEAVQPDATLRACMAVRLGSHVIPQENWHRVRPKPGMFLEAVPIPAGGETMRTVLMIAIEAAAMAAGDYIAGPAVLGSGGLGLVTSSAGFAFASAAIGGALTMGGMLALNALIPPLCGDPMPAHDSTQAGPEAGHGSQES